jgi:hypothetical protein
MGVPWSRRWRVIKYGCSLGIWFFTGIERCRVMS